MSATDFGSMNITIGILLECAVVLPKHETREDDSLVATRASFQTVDVLLRVRRVTDNEEPVSRASFFERFDYQMRIVLRLEPRDIQNIAIRFHSPFAHGVTVRTAFHLASISDHGRTRIMSGQVIILNHLGVGDDLVW